MAERDFLTINVIYGTTAKKSRVKNFFKKIRNYFIRTGKVKIVNTLPEPKPNKPPWIRE